MKTKSILTAIFLMVILFPVALTAQRISDDYYVISGTVKDAQNQKPIPYATIILPGTHVGTVANSQGYFSLKIRKDGDFNNIRISHLGYEPRVFSIEANIGKEVIFLMQSQSIKLQEVIFRPLEARDIVLGALDRVAENYPQEPYMLVGFYREAIKQRRDYVSIAEAIVDIRKEPYKDKSADDKVKLIRGRKSGMVKNADTLLVKLQGGPQVALMMDLVKNSFMVVSHNNIDHYNYEVLDLAFIDGRTHYVIGFEPAVVLDYPLFEGKLYICNETLAIAMADFGLDLSDKHKAAREFVRKKPAKLRFTPLSTRYLVTYQEIDGKYYLNYLRSDLEFFSNWRRKIFRTRYNLMFEMAVMDRSNQQLRDFSRRETFKQRSILADLVSVYFEDDFWGEYNFIEPDIDIQEAIKKLNLNFEPKEEAAKQ
jgi:hypothetical protein